MATHAVVWIDHHEAKVFFFHPGNIDEQKVHAPNHHCRHQKPPGEVRSHPDQLKKYYAEVSTTLTAAEVILIVGPASAKTELFKHIHKHHPGMEAKVVGIETVDHPTDKQLIAYARKYFTEHDPLLK